MIYPNPMIRVSNIEIIPKSLQDQDVLINNLIIFDALGRQVYIRNDISNYRIELNKNDLKEGYYIVKAIGEDGNEYFGKLMIH